MADYVKYIANGILNNCSAYLNMMVLSAIFLLYVAILD